MAEQARVNGKFAGPDSGAAKPAGTVDTGASVVAGKQNPVGDSIRPADADGRADEQRAARKGGWPKGKPRPAKGETQGGEKQEQLVLTDLSELNATLQFSHKILATVFSTPELELDNENAKVLTSALQNVNRHYGVRIKQKSLDWYHLFVAAAIVYGPRFTAISARKSAEKKERMKPKQATPPAPPPVPRAHDFLSEAILGGARSDGLN